MEPAKIVTFEEYEYLAQLCWRRILSQAGIHPAEAPRKYGYDTLLSIFQQQYQKYVRKNVHRFKTDAAWEKMYALYASGQRISAIAARPDIAFSPYLLSRQFIERLAGPFPQGVAKGVAKAVKHPELHIADARLRSEVLDCCSVDTHCSPSQDRVRSYIGVEHEARLQRLLGEQWGISHVSASSPAVPGAYQTEQDLRAAGYKRTPDVRLTHPIRVQCPHAHAHAPHGDPSGSHAHTHTVCWIDSKATFADPHSFSEAMPQLQAYTELYGPGLVIYWFGFVDCLCLCTASHHPSPPATTSTSTGTGAGMSSRGVEQGAWGMPVDESSRQSYTSTTSAAAMPSPSTIPSPSILLTTHLPATWRWATAEEAEEVRRKLPPSPELLKPAAAVRQAYDSMATPAPVLPLPPFLQQQAPVIQATGTGTCIGTHAAGMKRSAEHMAGHVGESEGGGGNDVSMSLGSAVPPTSLLFATPHLTPSPLQAGQGRAGVGRRSRRRVQGIDEDEEGGSDSESSDGASIGEEEEAEEGMSEDGEGVGVPHSPVVGGSGGMQLTSLGPGHGQSRSRARRRAARMAVGSGDGSGTPYSYQSVTRAGSGGPGGGGRSSRSRASSGGSGIGLGFTSEHAFSLRLASARSCASLPSPPSQGEGAASTLALGLGLGLGLGIPAAGGHGGPASMQQASEEAGFTLRLAEEDEASKEQRQAEEEAVRLLAVQQSMLRAIASVPPAAASAAAHAGLGSAWSWSYPLGQALACNRSGEAGVHQRQAAAAVPEADRWLLRYK